MNKAIRILACAAILGSAIFTGCNKNLAQRSEGESVNFSAISRGVPATKTAYGADVTEGTTTYQVISWEIGDKLRIASDKAEHRYHAGQHYADYVIVKDPTLSGHESLAAVDALDNETVPGGLPNGADMRNGLIWGEESAYTFWGIYPSTATNAAITIGDNGAVSATIPVNQPLNGTATDKTVGSVTYKEYKPDMNSAFMTAVAAEVKNGTDFRLVFNPAFTAFEFNVTSEDETPVELTGFEILSPDGSDKLAGTFTMTAGNLASVNASAGTPSVAVDMSSAHQTVNNATGLTFTVFTLPAANAKPLRIRFSSTNGTQTKVSRLDLVGKDGKALVFNAGTKYRINMLKLPSSQWKISIAPVFEPWVVAEEEEVVFYI